MNDDFRDFEEPYMIKTSNVYTKKTKKFSRPNWTFYFTLALAILFIIITMSLGADVRKVNKAVKTGKSVEATVVNCKQIYGGRRSRTRYYTYVDYEIDGQKYSDVFLDIRFKSRAVGYKLPVFYQPDRPNRVVARNSSDYDKGNMIFFGIMAVLFVVLSFVALTNPEAVQKLLAPGKRRSRWRF